MSAPAPPADFPTAAVRHLRDGEYLEVGGRIANADHLAGLAAECALKATLLDFLGAAAGSGGIPQSARAQGQPMKHNVHIPQLWDQVIMIARGRGGSAFLSALTSSRPVDTWHVAARYASDSAVTSTTTRTHLAAARSLVGRYERARILGVLA